VEGVEKKVVTPSGLCAHGRGEAFDYIIGETTNEIAETAIEAAVAALLSAKHPVISINGNSAALVPEDLVKLSFVTGALLEVNLFYHAPGRLEAIENVLRKAGATQILGLGDLPSTTINELTSNRRFVDPRGIKIADVVLVPLEDGDRTEALVKEGKFVIAIDLNPLSRTAQKAHITIVDNIVRCIPAMINVAERFKAELVKKPNDMEKIKAIKNKFNQQKNLDSTLEFMSER